MAYSSAPQSASAEAFQLDVKSKLEPAIHSEETTQGDRVAPASEIAAEVEIDEKENRKLLRKIDWHIIPLLCLVYGLQFLDKTSLSYASIMGIRQARHITLSEYSWLSSVFYLGYLVGEFPNSYLLARLPLAKWTAFNVFVWGAVLCCMAVAKDFAALMVVRFFLGFLESGITPAFTLVTSQWYRTNEQGTRTGIWFSCNALSQVIGACIAYGFAEADLSGDLSIPGWQVIFIFLGTITTGMGVVLAIFLPDSPLNARFLKPHEKQMAVDRIRGTHQEVGNRDYKLYQVKEAFVDPMTWLYSLYAVALSIPNGGFTNFFSILIQSFGYSATQSLLYTAPGGAVVFVFVISCLYLGDRYQARIAFAIFAIAVSAIGVLLIWFLPTSYKVGRLMGYYLSNTATVGLVVLISMIASNVAGHTKKVTVSAIFLIAYCVGNIIGPQTFRAEYAPRYTPALATVFACFVLGIIVLCLIWLRNVRENRRRAAIMSAPGYIISPEQAFGDLTDRENEAFFYTS